ncbi:MAG: type II toxin-antitoxin system RelE/ParE family toxin [Bacteroidetes bacterium]|nr:type II toxin-antitoxin system RelE/ParE family toxin [Bacteroidota bacterium]
MAQRLVWSARSRKELIDIFTYWNERTGDRKYSRKLYSEIRKKIQSVLKFNSIGKLTSVKEIRFIVVKDYLIFYKNEKKVIQIVTIWDNRRNPMDLKLN